VRALAVALLVSSLAVPGATFAARPQRRAPLPEARGAGTAREPTPAPPEQPRIVNGVVTSDYPAVGALLRRMDDGQWRLWCSATLIGCRTVLTAAHCACEEDGPACQTGAAAPDPGRYAFFLQNAGVLDVDAVFVHPRYRFPVADVSVMRLAHDADGIRPSAILSTAVPQGTQATIVGFGRTGSASGDYGIKRAGRVLTSACGDGVDAESSVCWRFAAPVGPAGEDSNTCNGDSGGPLFADLGAGDGIGGVTSGGRSATCQPFDLSFDASVPRYLGFIQRRAAGDRSEACGDVAELGSGSTSVASFSGALDATTREGAHAFGVAAGSTRLVVTLNGGETAHSRFRLFVKHGSQPTATRYDCRASHRGQFGTCSIADPAPGTWFVRVRRVAGGAPYQVTATSFSPAPTGD